MGAACARSAGATAAAASTASTTTAWTGATGPPWSGCHLGEGISAEACEVFACCKISLVLLSYQALLQWCRDCDALTGRRHETDRLSVYATQPTNLESTTFCECAFGSASAPATGADTLYERTKLWP